MTDIQLAPRIIGICGPAGSGKDTIARFILEILDGETISLASPFKEFAGKVFLFNQNQLYGPSSFRNATDPRYSYDLETPWFMDFTLRYAGIVGKVRKLRDWWKPARIAPPPRLISLEQIEENRRDIWVRYNQNETAFLMDVLPPGVNVEFGRVQLRKIMQQILAERNISPRLVLQLIGSEFGRAISPNIWVDRTSRKAQEIKDSGRTAIVTDVRFLNEGQRFNEIKAMLLLVEVPVVEELKAGVAGHVSEKEMRSPAIKALATRVIVNDKKLGLEHLRGLVHGLFFDA